jgi:pimeloyl-ACP methyl ester carboxylesterase
MLRQPEDGPAPVFLVHRITVRGTTWDRFVQKLAERFRVLTLDFRGHGKLSPAVVGKRRSRREPAPVEQRQTRGRPVQWIV